MVVFLLVKQTRKLMVLEVNQVNHTLINFLFEVLNTSSFVFCKELGVQMKNHELD